MGLFITITNLVEANSSQQKLDGLESVCLCLEVGANYIE